MVAMILPHIVSSVLQFGAEALLLFKILLHHDCRGISLVTLQTYLIIFAARYSHLLAIYLDVFSTFFAVLHIAAVLAAVLLIRFSPSVHSTYQHESDVIPTWALPIVAAGLSFILAHNTMITSLLVDFAWFLEAVVLVPQFALLLRLKSCPLWVLLYIVLMAVHRGILNFYNVLEDKTAPIDIGVAVVHTLVVAGGLLLLWLQQWRMNVHGQQKPVPNRDAEKPDFQKVWEAGSFQFTGDAPPGQGSTARAASAR